MFSSLNVITVNLENVRAQCNHMVTSLLRTEMSCLLFEWLLVILTKPHNSYLCDLSFPKMHCRSKMYSTSKYTWYF